MPSTATLLWTSSVSISSDKVCSAQNVPAPSAVSGLGRYNSCRVEVRRIISTKVGKHSAAWCMWQECNMSSSASNLWLLGKSIPVAIARPHSQ